LGFTRQKKSGHEFHELHEEFLRVIREIRGKFFITTKDLEIRNRCAIVIFFPLALTERRNASTK